MAFPRSLLSWTAALLVASAGASVAADHLDSPLPSANRQSDITDVYLFRSPADSRNVVIAVNHQSIFDFAGGNTGGPMFTDQGVYAILIDTSGDGIEDITLRTRFTDGGRNFSMSGFSFGSIDGQVTQVGEQEPKIFTRNSVKVFCGPRDDPFFFDLTGFNQFVAAINAGAAYFPAAGLRAGGAGAPVNFFMGNVASIVVEMPIVYLTNNTNPNTGSIKVSAKTFRNQL